MIIVDSVEVCINDNGKYLVFYFLINDWFFVVNYGIVVFKNIVFGYF